MAPICALQHTKLRGGTIADITIVLKSWPSRGHAYRQHKLCMELTNIKEVVFEWFESDTGITQPDQDRHTDTSQLTWHPASTHLV